ncbi:hypothetical protein [Aminipila terrae]|uniref:DUF4830 domain-containing protein n=1 Tax=Aminipila terrae TaxID=2697030 RepID=A0A6P1MAN3_9FIRM|nr:hypothetical protein [Aminipila terrae]QHI71739.1 hypothetical protein Ami3637_04475 [Aminipila terrae]
MRFSKKSLFVLIILVTTMVIFTALAMRDHFYYPENQFGIVESDSFCLTHLLNVNGVVGAEKTEFTPKEKRKIMNFLTSLQYKEPLPTRTETIYGVPVQIKVSKQDGRKLVFFLFSNIEVIEYDKDGDILKQNIYTTTEKQRSNIYNILGITQD